MLPALHAGLPSMQQTILASLAGRPEQHSLFGHRVWQGLPPANAV